MVTRQDLQQLCDVPRKKKYLMRVLSLGQKEMGDRMLTLKSIRKPKVNAQTLVNERLGWSTYTFKFQILEVKSVGIQGGMC